MLIDKIHLNCSKYLFSLLVQAHIGLFSASGHITWSGDGRDLALHMLPSRNKPAESEKFMSVDKMYG